MELKVSPLALQSGDMIEAQIKDRELMRLKARNKILGIIGDACIDCIGNKKFKISPYANKILDIPELRWL